LPAFSNRSEAREVKQPAITVLSSVRATGVHVRVVCSGGKGAVDAPERSREQQSNESKVMKRTILSGWIAAGLLLAGNSLLAGNGPGPNGRGYGGPPKSDEERAARQAACLERNGGVCPNGGPRADCPRYGQRSPGSGYGKGARQGLRDGTGPRAANGTCPRVNQAR
jgi:hypothetical protein